MAKESKEAMVEFEARNKRIKEFQEMEAGRAASEMTKEDESGVVETKDEQEDNFREDEVDEDEQEDESENTENEDEHKEG